MTESWMSIREASAALGVTSASMREWAKTGYGPKINRVGHRLFKVSRESLEQYKADTELRPAPF
jgi:DNA-binding transcriptional MerR regulator